MNKSYFWLIILLGVIAPVTAFADIQYELTFTGVGSNELLNTLRSISELEKRQNQPPPSRTALQHRADEDVRGLTKALRGLGYYDAEVRSIIRDEDRSTEVEIQITLGSRYTLNSFEVRSVLDRQPPYDNLLVTPDPHLDFNRFSLQDFDISLGDVARAKDILNAEGRLITLLADSGYPLADIHEREAVADQASKTLAVTVYVNSGPKMFFGETEILGLETVCEEVVQRKITWCEGELFSLCAVEDTHHALSQTQLFSLIDIRYAPELAEDGSLPLQIDLNEAKHRTVGFGVGFQTNRGLGVTGMWEHRNMRGQGERLSMHGEVQKVYQYGNITYRIPDWAHLDQDLIGFIELEHDQTEGYTERAGTVGARVERRFNDCLKLWLGASLKQQQVKDFVPTPPPRMQTTNNTLLTIPMGVRYNTADDPLDPSSGYNILFKSQPNATLSDAGNSFVSHELLTTGYWLAHCNPRIVLAGKAHFGATWGASLIDIPAPERFYAGSASTLRGYDYKSVGPLNSALKPIGGRSLMVYSAEARLQSTENIGMVSFFDFGNVFANSLPQFNKKLLKAWGVGLRYHTPVGPIRLDVAFPLDRRQGVDDSLQVYFSIGQAF